MAVYFWIATEFTSSPIGVWDSSSNWSFTEGGSSAGSYPDGTDDVAIVPDSASQYILLMGSFSSQLGMYIQLGSTGFYFDDPGSISANLFVFAGSGSVGNGNVHINGPCVFTGSASNYTDISGDCMFSGLGAANYYGYIYGDCLFPNSSQNQGYIYGNCLFTNGSTNSGTVHGTATFNGYDSSGATNTGNVNGIALPLPENSVAPGYTIRPLDVLGAGI